jgi:transposase
VRALGAGDGDRALALDGVVASMSVAAATSTAVFPAFAGQVLVPALRVRPAAGRRRGHGHRTAAPSRAARKAEAVRGALDRAGLGHRHLPPHSPDLDPIEQAWSELKARLRAEGARSLARSAGDRARPGARRDRGARCTRLVPPRRPRPRKLIRKPL